MIEILIPTYNRSSDLIKNIIHVDALIREEGLEGCYSIIISNNASSDDTANALEDIKDKISVELNIFNQDENIGLEKNAVFVLEKASSEYVVYLSDDDFFPKGYLTELSDAATSGKFGVVIPGCSALMPNGEIRLARRDQKRRSHEAGFKALADFAIFGHQLSGLFFKREGVVEAYKAVDKYRNIYPFIFFIAHVMKSYPSIYMPEYKMLITEGNVKDWRYDDSGLLTEIFKNYCALYPESIVKKDILCLVVMYKHKWRLRVGFNLSLAIKSFLHLMMSDVTDVYLKLLLPFLYVVIYLISFKNLIVRTFLK